MLIPQPELDDCHYMEASLSIADKKLLPHSINQPAHMHTYEIRIEEFKQNDLEWDSILLMLYYLGIIFSVVHNFRSHIQR